MSTVTALLPYKLQARAILKDLSREELRALAKKDEITTKYGSAVYITKVRNRSAKNTYVVLGENVKVGVRQQSVEIERAEEIIKEVHEYLKTQEVIQVDRKMGLHPMFTLPCRLYCTKEYARLAYIWHLSLFPSEASCEPQLVSVYVPEWKERIILVHPEQGYTYILGTDYFGEAKKSFLRQAMYFMKKQGGLGLHAGSKVLKVKKRDGDTKEVGFLLFGLSGTGKTTLTLHNHDLSDSEGVTIRQDDVVMMRPDGYCYGTEDSFFIKTEGLEPSQKVLYYAATRPHAAFENVKVREDGELDFLNYELTTNGRGIVRRKDIENTDDSIDLPKAHKIILIARREDIVPVCARLSPAQAAAFFMLGESIETSAGDPARAGQAKRAVGMNPFIVGPEAEEGNRFAQILAQNPDMECFLLNTGSVGKGGRSERGEKITIQVSSSIMKAIARDEVVWKKDKNWGYEVPESIPEVDMEKYNPETYYSSKEYQEKTEALRRERLTWLEQFPSLNREIVETIQ